MSKKKAEQFARVSSDMLRHVAFRTMSGSAVRVLFELWSRFNGDNNGDLWLSFRDAHALLGMNKAATARGFAELQARGFAVRTTNGHFAGRKAPHWRLTTIANKGMQPTNEWQRWEPGSDFKPAETDPVADIDAAMGGVARQ